MRILIADDHKVIRNLISDFIFLRDPACKVNEAHNGQEAVNMAMNTEYDLILMDISMPVLDGISATQHILNEKPHCKVIAVSMNTEQEGMAKMKKAGAKGYVMKDTLIDTLSEVIDQVLEGETIFP